ncbi:MAG: Ppx/GppA family phosphatase [Maricaulis sp.]|uniref:Ppx/GppA family phosphatase n=1 Tax=Maricaulis sp. TaxID=1486257 RepID=UPI001B221CA5|nr:Ppx/GppA family phosphatase [Maricaulis sp.]MBO6847851.1 Ppx/GppA family phosphatase [Maricaulis sp.]MBO6877474.1 Ppx/GppA family phosphatase [Maricaulis sp.]MDM7983542.1 Ppx/GppA family phosphatase [Maricaulis sp.]
MTQIPDLSAVSQELAVERDIAVIDIGSNTVRLVHFRLQGRAIWPVYNEKVMAGLGQGVRATGLLNADGRDIALRALKRFQRILEAKGVTDIHVVATAAVRNAEDGAEFVREIADLTALEVRILSGREEGEISALGLLAGIPDAHGMTGDLGGSSLELTPINNGVAGAGTTLALGPQEVLGNSEWDYDQARRKIDKRLDKFGLDDRPGQTFYAVGGAWRTLAHLAFAHNSHPLKVVHQYAMTAAEVRKITQLATQLSPASLVGTPGISRRRAVTLPYAALLLRRIVRKGNFANVCFSAYGLREGVLLENMPDAIRDQDPLIAGAEALARPIAPTPGFGVALAHWLRPMLSELEPVFAPRRDQILQEAACRLADFGARMHPDHRAELARDTVLYAPFAGLSHPERGFLGTALHFRHGGTASELDQHPVARLMNADQRRKAECLGLCLRLGSKLSGRSIRLLERFRIGFEQGSLCVTVHESVRDLYVERSVTQLKTIGGLIGVETEVRYVE